MKLTVERDLDALRLGVERWLGRPVHEISRPAPGYSCETLIVDRELVVRMPPAGDGIFPTYDLELQGFAQNAAMAAGVPVAGPAVFEPDPSHLGAPFLAMPFVDGPIPADFTPADPWLEGLDGDDERRFVWSALLDAVTRVHATDLGAVRPGGHDRLRFGLDEELDYWDSYLDWATDGDGRGEIADVLVWCRHHRPVAPSGNGLLWGDVRLGNVVFDAQSHAPRAVLDWDMTSAGPIEMDIAWYLALESVQVDATAMRVQGFGTREETLAYVERATGHSTADVEWHEVFALARAAAIGARIAVLFERAGRRPLFPRGHDPTLAAAIARIAL